jgi:hypothetical protein
MTRLPAAVSAAFLFVAPAVAQTACGPLEAALEVFRARHGEVPSVTMRDAGGRRLILLANPETRSWSLLVLPAGSEAIACLVAKGNDLAPVQRPSGRTS